MASAVGWAGKQGPQAASLSASLSLGPGFTLWDQHVAQDEEASHGQEAGNECAAAEEPEQEGTGGPAQEVHDPEEELEEEDVAPQALQIQHQPVVGDHDAEAARRGQRSGLCPTGDWHACSTAFHITCPSRTQPTLSLPLPEPGKPVKCGSGRPRQGRRWR